MDEILNILFQNLKLEDNLSTSVSNLYVAICQGMASAAEAGDSYLCFPLDQYCPIRMQVIAKLVDTFPDVLVFYDENYINIDWS